MRLLVTRPQPEAAETAARLEALGHEAVVEPLTTITFLPPSDIDFAPSALAFTSSNGVRAAAKWPISASWRDVTIFAVGEKTAFEARQAGFRDVRIGGGDMTTLVEAVVDGLDPLAGKLLHIAGRDRAGDLAGSLAGKGFDVVTVEAYAAVATDALGAVTRERLAKGEIDGALFFSRRAAAIFSDLMARAGLLDAAGGLALFAISEAAAEPLRQFGMVEIAARPDAESLIALIGR